MWIVFLLCPRLRCLHKDISRGVQPRDNLQPFRPLNPKYLRESHGCTHGIPRRFLYVAPKKKPKKQCCDGGPAKSEAEGNYHGDLARLNVRSVHPHSGSRHSARGLTLNNYSVKHFTKTTIVTTPTLVFLIPHVFGDSVGLLPFATFQPCRSWPTF